MKDKTLSSNYSFKGTIWLFMLVLSSFMYVANAQQRNVQGMVTDPNGEPIIGASVVVKGTTNGTITDFDGKFTLSNVPEKGIITITYIGYKGQDIPVAGKSTLKVTLAEDTKTKTKKEPKRANKLTNARIKKEIEFLQSMFAGIDDEDKKSLVNSLVEEAAFLKVACFQAKEELKKEGLTTETVNASQKFVKAHPSATIYEKYSRQYTAIIHSLIEYLPPKEKKNISRLAALRNG